MCVYTNTHTLILKLNYIPFSINLQNLNTEEQKASSNLNCIFAPNEPSSPGEEECPDVKKAKVDIDTRNTQQTKESVTANGSSINTEFTASTEDSKTDTESEPEEGEITDTEQEEYSSENEVTSEETVNSEDVDSEGEGFYEGYLGIIFADWE